MLETFRNAWKIEELRKKILFTLFIVLLYRLGNAVPVPYVDIEALKEFREKETVSQLTELLQKEAEIYYKQCEYFM